MHVAVRQIAHSVLGTAKTKLAAGMKLLHSKIQRGRRAAPVTQIAGLLAQRWRE